LVTFQDMCPIFKSIDSPWISIESIESSGFQSLGVGECKVLEKIEKGKHQTGFDCDLQCWIETTTQELDMLRNDTVTAAVLNSNVINPICM